MAERWRRCCSAMGGCARTRETARVNSASCGSAAGLAKGGACRATVRRDAVQGAPAGAVMAHHALLGEYTHRLRAVVGWLPQQPGGMSARCCC
jgi:hypothetical protein